MPKTPIGKRLPPYKPIPSLLSPTLPAVVEAALIELKGPRRGGSLSRAPLPTVEGLDEGVEDSGEDDPRRKRKSLIVTIKLREQAAQRAKEILSLPSRQAPDRIRKSEHVQAPPPSSNITSKGPQPVAASPISRERDGGPGPRYKPGVGTDDPERVYLPPQIFPFVSAANQD